MSLPSKRYKIRRTSDKLEIISILEQISSEIQSSDTILIGSRAALIYLPNIRDLDKSNIDHDIISSSTYLLKWLQKNDKKLHTIKMIIPSSNDTLLDLYVVCTMNNKMKCDFAIPRSLTSYTAYLLNNIKNWSYLRESSSRQKRFHVASTKLLLILKKYMLYYPHQWNKTAKDYQQLLTITPALEDEDKQLCNLFIHYNEILHGERSLNIDEFIVTSKNNEEDIIIKRDQFFQQNKDEQILCVSQTATKLSIDDSFLIGLEYICTKSPLWLTNFVIDNWMDIQNVKVHIPHSSIQFEINNYRLFEQLPELVIQKILSNLTNPLDFHSMKFVCKNWYNILNQQIFWRDLYLFRYRHYSEDFNKVINWKFLYLQKLENEIKHNEKDLEMLVGPTMQLRRTTANDVLCLWKDLTGQDHSVNWYLLSQIDYILSHSYYYSMKETSDSNSVKIVLIGLDSLESRSKISLNLEVGQYGSSYFTDHVEELSISFDEPPNKNCSLSFMGPSLFGYEVGPRCYDYTGMSPLTNIPSEICPRFPSGLLICLFIMMVHPAYRSSFISYLRGLESRCESCSMG